MLWKKNPKGAKMANRLCPKCFVVCKKRIIGESIVWDCQNKECGDQIADSAVLLFS